MYRYVNYCGLEVIGCCFRDRKRFITAEPNEDLKKQQQENITLDLSLMGR